ncbi:MAG: hypothetical protein ACK55P_06110, partial [Planctomyces sp.]
RCARTFANARSITIEHHPNNTFFSPNTLTQPKTVALPFQGRGVPGRDLGLESPSYMECSSSMPKRPSHSCPFVFIRGSKHHLIRVHSCSFVV